MIIKEMFYIPIKLKPELARASMTTSDVNKQWRSNFQQQINTNKIHNEKFNYNKGNAKRGVSPRLKIRH